QAGVDRATQAEGQRAPRAEQRPERGRGRALTTRPPLTALLDGRQPPTELLQYPAENALFLTSFELLLEEVGVVALGREISRPLIVLEHDQQVRVRVGDLTRHLSVPRAAQASHSLIVDQLREILV